MSAYVEPADGLGTALGAVTIFLVFGAVTWVGSRGVEPLTSGVQIGWRVHPKVVQELLGDHAEKLVHATR